MRILLVEDEELLSSIIAKGLRKTGYAVDIALDGEEALDNYEVNEYDLIILDLNLPKVSGMEVLKNIRRNDLDIKILILSARVKVNERVLGLDEGANDYLIKPFDFIELEARIRSLLRRSFSDTPKVMTLGPIVMDINAKKIYCNNETLALTRKEYSIFEYLLMNKNNVISAESLVEHVWDNSFDPFSNALRYHIHTLKKKLSEHCDDEIIKTVRGQGYIIEEDTI